MKSPKLSSAPKAACLLMPLLWMTGCGTAPVSEPAIVATSNPCAVLPLVTYDRPFNVGVADELAGLPPDARLRTVVRDYMAERDAIRACRGVR